MSSPRIPRPIRQSVSPAPTTRSGSRLSPPASSIPAKVSSHPLHQHREWLVELEEFFESVGQESQAKLVHSVALAFDKALRAAAAEEPTISVHDVATKYLKLTPQATTARFRNEGELMGAVLEENGRWTVNRAAFMKWLSSPERAA